MPKVSDYKLHELYDDIINQTNPVVTIWKMEYEPSRVLREIDPVAYRVGFNDWADTLDDCDDCDENPTECKCEVA